MRRKMRVLAACAVLPLALAALAVSGCYAVARPDARLRPGFAVAATGGVIVSPRGHTVSCGDGCTTGERRDRRSDALYQLHLQYAWGSRPGGAALAVAVEAPLSLARPYWHGDSTIPDLLVPARLDVFAALCHRGDWHCGAGLEVGAMPGAYLVLTRVLGGSAALSLTGRYLRNLVVNAPIDDQALQAQLALNLRALGLQADVFFSYTYASELGIDLGDPESAGEHRQEDWSPHLLVAGVKLAY
jgi:hypothetical protein